MIGPVKGLQEWHEGNELAPQPRTLDEELHGIRRADLRPARRPLPLHRQVGVMAPERATGAGSVLEVRTRSMAEAGAVAVQAAPDDASTQTTATEGTQAAAPQSSAATAEQPQPGGAAVDLDALARDVYRIICRRLRVERERSLGRLG